MTGSEYAATLVGDRLAALGIRQRPAPRGPGDNPHAESFFHALKAELIHARPLTDEAGLRHAIARYVRYYNHRAGIRPWGTGHQLTTRRRRRKTVSTKLRQDSGRSRRAEQ